jgi:hypothetical protein
MANNLDWADKIAGLKVLLKKVGRLWTGTLLSGYAQAGPYHCGNCRYLRAKNLCEHSAVLADFEVPKDAATGLPIVDPKRGCCEFVEPPQ